MRRRRKSQLSGSPKSSISLRDTASVVSNLKLLVSLQLLVLGVDLPAGVVVVTSELFIHCMEKVLDNGRKAVNLHSLPR